jgi:hypothetical protein
LEAGPTVLAGEELLQQILQTSGGGTSSSSSGFNCQKLPAQCLTSIFIMKHVVLLDGGGLTVGVSPLLIVLPHPRSRARTEYLISGGRLLEFTRVASPSTSPASWFIDQSCKSDGSILTATGVDPLFFLLPVLEASGSRLSPLHQSLSSYSGGDCCALLGLHGLQSRLAAVAEQREGLKPGLDDLLVRLDRPRALRVLADKVQRLARVLHEEAEGARARARAAMAGSFQVATSEAGSSASPSPAAEGAAGQAEAGGQHAPAASPQPCTLPLQHLEAALGIVAEYLSDAWLVELGELVGLGAAGTPAVVTPEAGEGGDSARAAAWASAAAHDPYTAISKYVHGQRVKEDGSAGGSKAALAPAAKPSLAHNKLAAAAKAKGVQSVTSFFSVVKKGKE